MEQKYSKEICTLDHTGELPQHVLDTLPVNQGAPVRHRCAACAYKAAKLESKVEIDKLVTQVEHLRQGNASFRQGGAQVRDGDDVQVRSGDTVEENDLDEGAEWSPNLLDSYPDSEFKNLTRSTVAML